MLNNYKALVKLRKQQFDQAEQDLASANAMVRKLQHQKEKLQQESYSIALPTVGKGGQLAALMAQKEAMRRAIEACEAQIEAAKRAKKEKENALKQASIAYEQAKAIEAYYVKKIVEKEKRDIQNSLDEIASQRFWRDNVGVRMEDIE
ncbi:flagellar FliJ family protein [Hydrogenimonas thermophila]|uniref:flagellar FliJ family protein n=1 Tax=Hydrogenimonas thermophila TaxID=223786 RepID=UPI002936EF03|nr:flagellar FliJ family protein [Hydrogenimonas thermophila]WOE70078.1 flagellar FliJ family protein [Hydrogenimonas thermophila]WOE72595.1 flagellar FliJ family protein [Hydrogenimonas thermophila]